MRGWQLAGLVVGATALFFTARPVQAQMWGGQPAPVVVAPAPATVAPVPVVVAPPAPVAVAPVWGAGPSWGARRYYRPFRRGWYGAAWGPRRGVFVARRW